MKGPEERHARWYRAHRHVGMDDVDADLVIVSPHWGPAAPPAPEVVPLFAYKDMEGTLRDDVDGLLVPPNDAIALGADPGAGSAYHRSKKAADDVLRDIDAKLTGVTFPFVSFGMTSLVVNMGLLALALSGVAGGVHRWIADALQILVQKETAALCRHSTGREVQLLQSRRAAGRASTGRAKRPASRAFASPRPPSPPAHPSMPPASRGAV